MGSPVLLNTGCWLSWPIQSGCEVPEERIRKGKRDKVVQTRQATMASSLKKLVLYPLLLQLVSMFRAAPSTLEQVPRSLYFTIDLKSRGSLGPYPMTNPLHHWLNHGTIFQKKINLVLRFLNSQFFFPQEQKYEPDSVPRPPEWTDLNSLQQIVAKPFLSRVKLSFLSHGRQPQSHCFMLHWYIVWCSNAPILGSLVPSFPVWWSYTLV